MLPRKRLQAAPVAKAPLRAPPWSRHRRSLYHAIQDLLDFLKQPDETRKADDSCTCSVMLGRLRGVVPRALPRGGLRRRRADARVAQGSRRQAPAPAPGGARREDIIPSMSSRPLRSASHVLIASARANFRRRARSEPGRCPWTSDRAMLAACDAPQLSLWPWLVARAQHSPWAGSVQLHRSPPNQAAYEMRASSATCWCVTPRDTA